jgi:hypothetical protein
VIFGHHFAYLRYVLRHKRYVYVACRLLGVSFWRAVIHDWTKFRPSEWGPYASHFYGPIRVGDRVFVTADNMGASAVVLRDRGGDGTRYFVRWQDGQEFWAFEGEIRKEGSARYAAAWNLHQKRSKHHWQ